MDIASPLWLLDVDGVLNGVGAGTRFEFNVGEANGYQICWRNAVVDAVNSSAHEVRWLTTWCDTADAYIKPLLGLDKHFKVEGAKEFASGSFTSHGYVAPKSSSGWWKLDAVKRIRKEEGTDRLIIWTDDDIPWYAGAREFAQKNNILSIAPNTEFGLTDKHLQEIKDKEVFV